MVCGFLTSPQFAHVAADGRLSAWCERRRSLLEDDVLNFGTAMFVTRIIDVQVDKPSDFISTRQL